MSSSQTYEKQVDASHYNFKNYFFPARWMSYWYQIKEITSRPEIESVLDVGPGTDMLRAMLKIHATHISYTTVDVAGDVAPDIYGSITQLPVAGSSYDVVCAFQVLEHIDFGDVEQALAELKRATRKYVFISLPHFGPTLEFLCKVPFLARLRLATKIPWPKRHVFQGQHYWEIGKQGYSPKVIRTLLEKHFTIKDEYVPFENQYHRFYILEKK